MNIVIKPVGFVSNQIPERQDDNWNLVSSVIELIPSVPAKSLEGLDGFSHAEIIFYMHTLEDDSFSSFSRIPRKNPNFPEVGIFAQRASKRPNKIGSTIVKLTGIENNKVNVNGLDAIDGTPVIDIKPVMKEFLPAKDEIRQPDWVTELMKNYW